MYESDEKSIFSFFDVFFVKNGKYLDMPKDAKVASVEILKSIPEFTENS